MSFITQLGNWLRKISTSITSLSVSGRTITYTRHNGDTGTIQTQDTTYSDATQNAHGLMSASDKAKLDGVATGAEVNQNAYSNIKVGNTTIAADGKTDTLELVAGNNVTLTPDATNDKVTIAATNTVYTIGTASGSGNAITALTISGSTITPTLGKTFSESTHTHSYLPLSGGTLTGALTFANNVWNTVGDDVKIGDFNKAGLLGVMGANGTTGIAFCKKDDASSYKTITYDGTNLSLGGYTLLSSVPANAKFTDTVTTASTSGSGNAVTSITASNGALTVKKDSTFSLSNHTHHYAGSSSAGGAANSLLNFTSGLNGVAEHNANNITTNGHWYYTSNGPATSLGATVNDGALYSQAYSANWVAQIAQDYRNGNLFVRGRNNGTWKDWQAVLTNNSSLNAAKLTGTVPASCYTNTVYTHPTSAGNKHIPAGGSSGQILRWSAAGTAAWGADNNTTYSNMGGASSSAAGSAGLVPAPAKGYQARFLRGDATWQVPTDLIKNFLVSSGTGVGRFMAVTGGTTIPAGSWLIFGMKWITSGEDTNGTSYCIFKTISSTVNILSITGGSEFRGWAWRYA